MNTIAHLSDLHFGREVSAVVEGLLDSLNELKPDLVIISGDLTQRAKNSEFKKAVSFLEQLPFPYLIVPGNHDMAMYNLAERFFYPWKKWQRYIGPDMYPIVRQAGLTAMGINTARRTGWHLDWSRGSINEEQIRTIEVSMKNEASDSLRLLVAHHPFWLPKKFERRHVIDGRDTALQSLNKAGIDIILSGHIHIAYSKIMEGVLISHTGTTFSNRLMADTPNSYNVIRGNWESVVIELMGWGGKAFSLLSEQRFSRGATGWQIY
jgi:3',5'-cyclic AMP phosphodiesterase CpdA